MAFVTAIEEISGLGPAQTLCRRKPVPAPHPARRRPRALSYYNTLRPLAAWAISRPPSTTRPALPHRDRTRPRATLRVPRLAPLKAQIDRSVYSSLDAAWGSGQAAINAGRRMRVVRGDTKHRSLHIGRARLVASPSPTGHCQRSWKSAIRSRLGLDGPPRK